MTNIHKILVGKRQGKGKTGRPMRILEKNLREDGLDSASSGHICAKSLRHGKDNQI
jgi:hypothetical protein